MQVLIKAKKLKKFKLKKVQAQNKAIKMHNEQSGAHRMSFLWFDSVFISECSRAFDTAYSGVVHFYQLMGKVVLKCIQIIGIICNK